MITKEYLLGQLDKKSEEIINIGEYIFNNPELGYKEHKTSKAIKEYLDKYNISYTDNLSITGLRATIGDLSSDINVGIVCEMDAVPTKGHPCSSDDLDAAHSCGHSNQVAIMLGAFTTLYETGILDELGAKVTLIATPSEEYTDFNFREGLIRDGAVDYLSGKQDMLSKGVFDDIDLIVSCHTMGSMDRPSADVNSSLNGFIRKRIEYRGVSAHAGACPHLGKNALNAANLGLMAVNTLRETFEEKDYIRFHSIITEGGHTVNTIPERVVIEAYVRGHSVEGILKANGDINRALESGAYAIGCSITITDYPGYMPFLQCRDLSEVLKSNINGYVDHVIDGQPSMASGDIGDLGYIIPTIQFGFSGFTGRVHGPDFRVDNRNTAYITPAKAVLGTIYDLCKEKSQLARSIASANPRPTIDEYMDRWHNRLGGSLEKDFSTL